VEKRVYLSGYNMQWKNSKQTVNKQKTVSDTLFLSKRWVPVQCIKQPAVVVDPMKPDNILLTASIDKSVIFNKKKSYRLAPQLEQKVGLYKKEVKQFTQSGFKQKSNTAADNKPESKIYHPITIRSIILLALSIILGISVSCIALLVHISTLQYIFVLLLSYLCIAAIVLALISSILAIRTLRREPDRYKGKAITTAVFLISICEALALLILILSSSFGGGE